MQKGRIYARYEAHPSGQKFKFRTKKSRSYIIENGYGQIIGLESSTTIPPQGVTFFDKTRAHEVAKMQRKGKAILCAERGNLFEIGALERRDTAQARAKEVMNRNRDIHSIINYFTQEANFELYRHELAARSADEAASKGKTELTMGSLHSVLTKDLRERGLRVSHKIKPTLFEPAAIVIRKLMLGKKPTEMEYLRAGVSEIYTKRTIGDMCNFLFGKFGTNASNYDFVCAIQKAMLDSLTKEQLEQILNEKRPTLIFELNHLPDPIGSSYSTKERNRKAYIKFLEGDKSMGWKGSEFWKRLPIQLKKKMSGTQEK